jgi:hypothetical protein
MKTGNLTRRNFQLATVLTISLFIVAAFLFAQSAPKQDAADNKPAAASNLDAKQIQINLDEAAEFDLPNANSDLTAVSFNTPDGKEGWMMPSRVGGRSPRRPMPTE